MGRACGMRFAAGIAIPFTTVIGAVKPGTSSVTSSDGIDSPPG